MNDFHDCTPAGPARVVLAKRKNAGIQVTLLWTRTPSRFSSETTATTTSSK
jgi:hypothetical protein